MKGKNNNSEKQIKKGKDSPLITKESLTAVCALFSLLALLILCTDALIFGEIGKTVHDFLLGVFGYCAYPFFVGTLYLSVASFMDKRFVKKRYVFAAFLIAAVCLLIVVQTAITYSWEVKGYAAACFEAGTEYSTATLVGWLGGLIIAFFSSFLSKIGAMIALSLLCLACIYFVAVGLTGRSLLSKKEKKEQQTKVPAPQPTQSERRQEQAPAPTSYANQPTQTANPYPPMQREGFPEATYSYAPQRPQFTINENGGYAPAQNNNANQSGAFSPFGGFEQNKYRGEQNPTATLTIPSDPAGRREFLFGGSSAEIYQKNLIFDSNASVNKRPPVDPNQPAYGGQNGFSSYTRSYEEELNNEVRPQKIVTDNTPVERKDYTGYSPVPARSGGESYLNMERTPERESAFPETPPAAETFGSDRGIDRGIERGFERTQSFLQDPVRQQPSVSIPEEKEEIGRETPQEREEGYRRHEYMDLFSTENPNVFGNREDTPRVELDTPREFLRSEGETVEPESYLNETRNTDTAFEGNRMPEREIATERGDSLNIFDDEEEDKPETVETPSRDRGDFLGFESRGRERSLDSVRFSEERIETPKIEQPAPASEPPKPPKPRVYRPYSPAPLHYFNCSDVEPDADDEEVEMTKEEILHVYEDFGVTGVSIASVTFGPTITRYNIVAPRSVSPSKLVSKDVETAMAMSLRVESGVNIYPNFKDGVISIEVPNKKRQTVHLGCMLTGPDYINAKPTSLVFSMGKNVANQKIYGDICKMTHLLVAGSSGSGKSVFLGTLIISLINHYSPQQLRLILIDPKKTEFVIYRDLPHLMINEIINEPRKAVQSLGWAIGEMNRRYELFEKMSLSGTHVVNIDEYNAKLKEGEEKLPKIVIVVDELADLMLAAKKDVEERIQNLTQKSRAAGIHLIIATQRPSADVITGVIKANLATRIAFMVASDVDSRVILDASGAQKLLGYGDMMYITAGQKEPLRLQSAFISSDDTQKVVEHIKTHNDAYFDEEATSYINNSRQVGDDGAGDSSSDGVVEEVYIEALKIVVMTQSASISMIQRKCSVGYNKAGKIIEWMEDMGYISPFDGAKARKVLITKEEFEAMYGSL